jgi:hypothetical protein
MSLPTRRGRELEDLFSIDQYLNLVNASHADVPGFAPIKASGIDSSTPICDALKKEFAKQGLGGFQKLRPAMELQRRLELGEAPDDETLAQFAVLFGRLNSSLAPA